DYYCQVYDSSAMLF
nr:immunoglobulin light chain junction region [Macaca mulatta]MOX28758.1 immunoglobulin light chain junction region [Macaca mulatta]MOX28802.1 immunoglobulin light chain junction region [Macaca mulatta]MOX31152.1 immunoglobulin light chain junction region [Macaca mulatta]